LAEQKALMLCPCRGNKRKIREPKMERDCAVPHGKSDEKMENRDRSAVWNECECNQNFVRSPTQIAATDDHLRSAEVSGRPMEEALHQPVSEH
jgi:hypothetical protein